MKNDKEITETKKAGKTAAVKKEKPAKKTKEKKPAKTVKAAKLPKLMKKKYSEKAFNKKILKRIYIDSDARLVKSVFELQTDSKGRNVYAVDITKELEADKVKRLKVIAKQIKQQKAGIKWGPLVAVVVLLAGIGLTVTAFKNVIVEKVIVSSLQGIFQAEANVKKVDLQIFGATLDIRGIEQTNKDDLTRNLFQLDNITVNFNLTDLLKGKFHAEKLSVEGVALNTERKKPGKLVEKKSKKEKKAESKIAADSKDYSKKASERLVQMFAQYNPEVMIADIQKELKSPVVAKTVQDDVQKQVEKWQAIPAKLEASVNSFTESVQDVISTDWSGVTDPAKLKAAIETINKASSEGQAVNDLVVQTSKDMKSDTELVAKYASDIQNAIESDRNLIDSKVNQVKSLFSADGMKDVMGDAVKAILYDVSGKYYPYVSKAVDGAMSSMGSAPAKEKASADDSKKKAKKAKKDGPRRLPGRTVYYRKDVVPKFYVEEAVASGYEYGTDKLLFKGTARDVSSDQNMTGKTTSVDASFSVMGNANYAKAVIDARKDSAGPLLLANYNGEGYTINANAEIFNLKSKSDITALVTAHSNGTAMVSGVLDMNVSEMTGMDFEPAAVCKIYKNALSEIRKLTVGFEVGMDENGEFTVNLKEFDKLSRQLSDPIVAALSKEVNAIAVSAKNDAIKMLTEKTGGASDSIAKFMGISDSINGEQKKVQSYQDQMEAKKKEIQAQLSGKASDAAKDALKNAGVDTDKAKDVLKGFKGLKF